jgi:hypothetical protein
MNNNVPQAICSGDSILLAGTYQTAAGTYTDIFASAQGCDSLVHTALTINPNVSANATATICEGNTIMLGGALQNSAGTYMDTLISFIGCDSVITHCIYLLHWRFIYFYLKCQLQPYNAGENSGHTSLQIDSVISHSLRRSFESQ